MYALPKPSFRPHSTRGTLQTLKRSTTTPLWSSKSASATPIFGGAHAHLPLRRFFVATGSKSQAVASTEAHGRKINPNEPGKVSSNDTPAIAHTLARHPKDFPLTIGGAPGRNLSERWIQKERSLRKKQGLVKQFEELQDGCQTEDISTSEDTVVLSAEALSSAAVTFKGFVIPQEPKPPADDGKLPHLVLMTSLTFLRTQNAACRVAPSASTIYMKTAWTHTTKPSGRYRPTSAR